MEMTLNNMDGNGGGGISNKSYVNNISNSSIASDYTTNPLANELNNDNSNSNVKFIDSNSINNSVNEERVLSTPFLMTVIMSYSKLYSIIY